MHTKDDVTLRLSAKGAGAVTAGQIEGNAQVEVVNKDFVLCHLADEKSSINVEMTVSAGSGYESVEDRTALNSDEKPSLGEIQLDALYSPIVRVNYKVENTRVGRITDYDRLVFEIVTDGTISGFDALRNAAQILADNFAKLAKIELSNVAEVSSTTAPVKAQGRRSVLIEELDLSPKIANRLRENGFATADDVVRAGRDELLKMSNFGEKSLKELEVKLAEKGYSLE
jgi:DNA-directed RNA polymerase subunit alpha